MQNMKYIKLSSSEYLFVLQSFDANYEFNKNVSKWLGLFIQDNFDAK